MHGSQWRAVLFIPHDVRPALGGKSYFLQPLGTPDLDEANRLKGAWLTKWRSLIAGERNPDRTDLTRARILAHALRDADEERLPEIFLDVVKQADAVEKAKGQVAGDEFFRAANDTVALLDEFLEPWIIDRRYTGRTAMQHRMAFKALIEWCKGQRISPTLQKITKRAALRFRDERGALPRGPWVRQKRMPSGSSPRILGASVTMASAMTPATAPWLPWFRQR
jgi:hypothetical protein